MQSQMAKQEAMEATNLFVSALKNPVATLEHVFATKKNTAAFILGAVHLLLLFLCTTIYIPLIGDYMKTSDRAKVGLVLLLIAGIPVAVTPEEWFEQTVALAKRIYEVTPEGTTVSYDYVNAMTPVIEQQLLFGGLRLAALLNALYQ